MAVHRSKGDADAQHIQTQHTPRATQGASLVVYAREERKERETTTGHPVSPRSPAPLSFTGCETLAPSMVGALDRPPRTPNYVHMAQLPSWLGPHQSKLTFSYWFRAQTSVGRLELVNGLKLQTVSSGSS
jgi:hypothetical protein